MEALRLSEEDVVTSDIKLIIKYLWSSSYIQVTVLAVFYWIFAALIAFNLVVCRTEDQCRTFFGEDFEIGIRIASRVLMVLFFLMLIFYEICVIVKKGLSHFNDLDNIIDSIVYVCFIPIFGFMWIGAETDTTSLWNFLTCIFILSLGIRSVLHLRVFSGMRYLITMIIQVIIDIKEFIVLLFLSVVMFAFMELLLSKTEEDSDYTPTFDLLLKTINSMYQTALSNFGPSDSMPWNFYSFFLLETIILPMILINFLIAIIIQTFG